MILPIIKLVLHTLDSTKKYNFWTQIKTWHLPLPTLETACAIILACLWSSLSRATLKMDRYCILKIFSMLHTQNFFNIAYPKLLQYCISKIFLMLDSQNFVIFAYQKFLWYCISKTFSILHIQNRVEICRDRHDRRSCKICASCVNFPGKQRNFSHNLHRTTRFTPAKCNFALKLLKFYTLS